MSSLFRRAVSLMAGTVVFFALIIWSFWVGYGAILALLPIGLASEIESMGFAPESVYYLKDHDVYTTDGFVFLAFAGGLTATLLVWNGELPKKTALVLMVVSFLVLLPLSAANYAHGDLFSTRSVQALINIPLALLGILVLMAMYDLKLSSRTANVLRIFAGAFILMQAVLTPMLYSVLWWLNFQNAISAAATRDLAPGWISVFSSLAGLAFGVFKYIQSNKPQENEVRRTIWLPGDPK